MFKRTLTAIGLKQAVPIVRREAQRRERRAWSRSMAMRGLALALALLVGPAALVAGPSTWPAPAPIPDPCALAPNLPYCKPWRP